MKAITIRFSEEDISLVENFRRKMPSIPNYSEAVRILMRRGAEKK